MSQAKESIIIIDPYFYVSGLNYLIKVQKSVVKKVYKSKYSALKKNDVDQYRKQYGDIEIHNIEGMHDRFIIIDNTICYGVGASLNFIGNKTFEIHNVESQQVIDSILKIIA